MLATSSRRVLSRSSIRKELNPSSLIIRTFSITSSMSTFHKEWLAIIPDKPNSLQKRLAARPLHLEKVAPRVEVGQVVFGGATLDEQPAVDGTPAMNGSVMLFKADTEEEVRSLIENDDYAKADVWDVANAKIMPFRSAIRTAL